MKKSKLMIVGVVLFSVFAITGIAFANSNNHHAQTEQTVDGHHKKEGKKCTKGKCTHDKCTDGAKCGMMGKCEHKGQCKMKNHTSAKK